MKCTLLMIFIFLNTMSSWASPKSINPSYETLAKNLSSLREEVEGINSELKEMKEMNRSTIKSLVLQKAEFETSLQRTEIEVQQFQEKISELKGNIQKAYGKSWNLTPALEEYTKALEDYVDTSIPYKLTERLDAIREIKNKIVNKEESPLLSLQSLWAALDDEVRLSKEISLAQQVINIEGKAYQSEVAHLGSVFLFFRVSGKKVGQAVYRENQWHYEWIQNKKNKLQVVQLLEGIKKQIRTGEYELPLFMTL